MEYKAYVKVRIAQTIHTMGRGVKGNEQLGQGSLKKRGWGKRNKEKILGAVSETLLNSLFKAVKFPANVCICSILG